jgi:long-chain acyl-CoA synthetase
MISHNSLAANVRFAQNNMDYIAESLVIREDNKLIGLICPDFEMMKRDNITEDQLPGILEKIRKDVNERIPEYMVVNK